MWKSLFKSPKQPVAKILETLLPYFGLTDLLTDDLELSVILSPPLIKFASNTYKTMRTNLEKQLWMEGWEGVFFISLTGYYIAPIWSKKATGISSECLNPCFNYELLLKSQYKKMMPIKFFINNWKGYICTFKTFIQRDTNLWFVSSEAPKVQLKDIQSVYCEFRQPAPKTIPMLKLYFFSREKNGENQPLLLLIRE